MEPNRLSSKEPPSKKVVYLLGAGATHANVTAVGTQRILTRDLLDDIALRCREVYEQKYRSHPSIRRLVNQNLPDSDIEQVITFLDESASAVHRRFADDIRIVFEEVLRERLELIRNENDMQAPVGLYAAPLDMYTVRDYPEVLGGILTTNYDDYIEDAARIVFGEGTRDAVDLGVYVAGFESQGKVVTLVKLHGSFGWQHSWPIQRDISNQALWIPPGIQKLKGGYPFNMLWGRARELLNCDILRVIGCRLGSNDWDLISLLFTTRHARLDGEPYTIEVIDSPEHTRHLQNEFPYLEVQSLFDLDPVGERIVGELSGVGAPIPLSSLTSGQRNTLDEAVQKGRNWFLVWLKHMAEHLFIETGSTDTNSGELTKLLEEYA